MDSVSIDTFVGGIALPVLTGDCPDFAESAKQNGTVPLPQATSAKSAKWSYDEAFKRNRGLITAEEQEKLRNSRVAIAGMGGVGGVHLVTLARLGIGKFTIADPDVFEVANFNRQYGATISNLGRNKAEAMAEIALDINPELDLRVMRTAVDESNVGEFLDNADVLVDSLDAFSIDSRRTLFRIAAELGIYGIGVGPVGFSAVWVAFAPQEMSFDEYFALTDAHNSADQFINYIVGMAPEATHRTYVDSSYVNMTQQYGPSAGATCHLVSGILGIEMLKILLGRGRIFPAPYYHQYDAYMGKYVRGRLARGNRSLMQRIKSWYLHKLLVPRD